MKLSLNETTETKQHPKASLTNKPTTNNKQHTKTKRTKSREMHILPRKMETERERRGASKSLDRCLRLLQLLEEGKKRRKSGGGEGGEEEGRGKG